MFLTIGIYAQSADVITQILETDEVTCGQICYLSAVRQNLISEDDSFEKAVEVLAEKYQLGNLLEADYAADVQTVAYLYMKIWPDVKGGLFYLITGGSPRYAYKHLKALHVISDRYDPHAKLNGMQALNLLTSCMNTFGTEDECMSMEIE